MVMTLKQLITDSYAEKTYKDTIILQQTKIKASSAKNQLIFLERCIKNNVLPKSFRLKPPMKSTKGINIIKNVAESC